MHPVGAALKSNLPCSDSMPASKLPGRVSLQGGEHTVQLARSVKYHMKFGIPGTPRAPS